VKSDVLDYLIKKYNYDNNYISIPSNGFNFVSIIKKLKISNEPNTYNCYNDDKYEIRAKRDIEKDERITIERTELKLMPNIKCLRVNPIILLKNINNHFYVELGKSNIDNIGLIAIREIKKNQIITNNFLEELYYVTKY
jgi:hypothetical protein